MTIEKNNTAWTEEPRKNSNEPDLIETLTAECIVDLCLDMIDFGCCYRHICVEAELRQGRESCQAVMIVPQTYLVMQALQE